MSFDVGLRGGLRAWLLLVAAAGLTLFLLTGGTDTAAAKWSQPTCGKFKKQVKQAQKRVRQAKGSAKSAARHQLRAAKYRQKQCADNRLVWNQVKDSHIVGGTDYVGTPSDDVWCANGKWRTGTIVHTTGWRITDARVRNRKNFTAAIAGSLGKAGIGIATYERGIVRKGGKWEYGIISFGVIEKSAPATLTNAKSICATL